jgi:hypothetical protein
MVYGRRTDSALLILFIQAKNGSERCGLQKIVELIEIDTGESVF